MNIKNLLILFLALAFCIPAKAQKIPLENFTVQNGLPQNSVFDIEQDHQGYLWFATQVGVARFDGYDFKYFNTSNGLPDNWVNCLMVDGSEKVWIGTDGGIAIYSENKLTTLTVNDGIIDNRIDRIVQDSLGNTWVVTAYGISVILEDTTFNYTFQDALYPNFILDIFIDNLNRIHIATNGGVTVFSSPFDYQKILKSQIVRDIEQASDGSIWYATEESGIVAINDKDTTWFGEKDGLTDHIILSLLQDSKGRMWCGTYLEGIHIYEDGRFTNLSAKLDKYPVALEIYQDRQERIWIRTPENGIWLYENDQFSHIRQLNNLVQNNVQDLFEDSNGNIWIGTLGGASKYGRVIFEVWDSDFGLPDNTILSVFSDSHDNIWFGTYGYLLIRKKDELLIIDLGEGFQYPHTPLSFAEDSDNNIWIGSDLGLLMYDGTRISDYGLKTGLAEISVNDLVFSETGVLWCATDSGIFELRKGKQTGFIGQSGGLVDVHVNALDLHKNVLCCATEGGISLFDIDGRHISSYTEEDGLPSGVCLDIMNDYSGNIWVATEEGLAKISLGEEEAIKSYTIKEGLTSDNTYFVEFEDSTRLWIGNIRGIDVLDIQSDELSFYGYEEGFTPLETNSRAISRSSNGHLWIGTANGLVHYRPDNNQLDTDPPMLILFPPLIDGKSVNPAQYYKDSIKAKLPGNLVLPYNKNSLTFNFTGIHHTIPEKNNFSYFLEGYDDEWSEPSSQRSAEYKKLPPGAFTFKLVASNLDGFGREEPLSYSFEIEPPFWRTVWFIILEILIGLMIVYGFIKYRERQLIREKQILEEKVTERTREIEDQKVEIEAQRDEISEQKNFVEKQRDRIAFQNKEITDSIVYAKRIQQAALPGDVRIKNILPEHFILFKPRDIVSGDFYWIEEKEDLVIVCAADCTGHGVPGAFMSLLGLTFLNEIVNKDIIVTASKILDRLREYIITALTHRDEYGDTSDGMDLSLVVINKSDMKLEYAGAYNPLIIVRKHEVIEIKADKMPIGKHVVEMKPFTNHVVDLKANDVIYLFSDGYPDQFGGENGSKYKSKPFKRLLQRISTESMSDQRGLLDDELMDWMGINDQVDDILVMGMRIK